MPRRLPTLLGFVTLGLFWGSWASVLPDVQRATGASKGALGFALLFVSLGSIPAMLFVAGPMVDRFGGRAVAVAGAAFAAATTLPGLATSIPLLAVALLIAGAASGALDVGINSNAGRIESETGERIMPLAHGLYSVGILVGAVSAGLARNAGVHREAILLTVAVLIAATAALIGADPAPPSPSAHGATIRIERALLLLGSSAARRSSSRAGSRTGARSSSSASSTPGPPSPASGPASSERRWRSAGSTARRRT